MSRPARSQRARSQSPRWPDGQSWRPRQFGVLQRWRHETGALDGVERRPVTVAARDGPVEPVHTVLLLRCGGIGGAHVLEEEKLGPPSLLMTMSRAPLFRGDHLRMAFCDHDSRTSSWRFSESAALRRVVDGSLDHHRHHPPWETSSSLHPAREVDRPFHIKRWDRDQTIGLPFRYVSPRQEEGKSNEEAPRIHRERPTALGPYSRAIVAGGFVFCSGTIGIDPNTGLLP